MDCKIGTHCYIDYPMYYITINRTETIANRGCPEEIEPQEMAVTDEEIQKLKRFCGLLGVEWQEPKWWLVSDWG